MNLSVVADQSLENVMLKSPKTNEPVIYLEPTIMDNKANADDDEAVEPDHDVPQVPLAIATGIKLVHTNYSLQHIAFMNTYTLNCNFLFYSRVQKTVPRHLLGDDFISNSRRFSTTKASS